VSAGTWIGIALLGGLGAVLRHVVDAFVAARSSHHLPWGIFVVNISGAFGIGLLTGAGAGAATYEVVGVGLLGAYTTFSTWMLQVDVLRRGGRHRAATTYVVASVLLGLAAVWLGRLLASGG
jgi:CrcB protein